MVDINKQYLIFQSMFVLHLIELFSGIVIFLPDREEALSELLNLASILNSRSSVYFVARIEPSSAQIY